MPNNVNRRVTTKSCGLWPRRTVKPPAANRFFVTSRMLYPPATTNCSVQRPQKYVFVRSSGQLTMPHTCPSQPRSRSSNTRLRPYSIRSVSRGVRIKKSYNFYCFFGVKESSEKSILVINGQIWP